MSTGKLLLVGAAAAVGLYVVVRAVRAAGTGQSVAQVVLNPSVPIIPPARQQARFGAGHFV